MFPVSAFLTMYFPTKGFLGRLYTVGPNSEKKVTVTVKDGKQKPRKEYRKVEIK